ncbi:TetR family transcriptional regulator C-terminal domain-containing protein, partial [Streptomyces sp. NPDC059668]|uniref:TetR family transcriptional regulator C-terminal domain-containing protein n=1 Tax=Streptomyces sp. NPDC059668 TaxID=3346900 RepID=UPI0036CD629A
PCLRAPPARPPGAARPPPALRVDTRDHHPQWTAAITAVIAEGVAGGEFRCPDPAGAALRLTALLDGLAVQMTAYTGAVSRARAQEWVDDALARELGLDRAALTAAVR